MLYFFLCETENTTKICDCNSKPKFLLKYYLKKIKIKIKINFFYKDFQIDFEILILSSDKKRERENV